MAVDTSRYNTYENPRYHTVVKYPASWEEKEGELSGGRKLEAFVDPADFDNSISVVFTAVPADYTRLNSFGGPENLKRYLVMNIFE